ncbi:MAG: nucleoside deaminase, partial [Deltaproteobacteria bacterium]|nr:nucleoside deaminase [Deltaproteobacteria bacterium]
MGLAIEQAKIAYERGEVPIGAVVGDGSNVIAVAHNEIETRSDPTAHAEVLAIQRAAKRSSNWRLHDIVLCSTLEPCTMCCGAIKLARVPVVVFGASDQRAGAFGSIYDLSIDSRSGL